MHFTPFHINSTLKRRTVFLLILLIVSSFSLRAQTFEKVIQKANLFYQNGDYSGSAKQYALAFTLREGNAAQYYDAACAQALAGDTAQALRYLSLAIDKGWWNLKHTQRDKDLLILHETQRWNNALKKIQANRKEYEKNFDIPLKEKLERIFIKDQTLRKLYSTAEKKFGRNSEEMKYYRSLIWKQDTANVNEVVVIIEQRGWIGKSVVGEKANTALWVVIQHAPLALQEKYLPLLKASVLKGESKGSHLALLEDRIQMRKGEPQIYGSQIITDKKTGKKKVYKIKDPEYVDQRREKVGLGPIETYVKYWGIKWTIEPKKK